MGMVVALLVFFVAFNILEALQPSLVSRVAPPEYKGLALGFYNTAQSLGVFGGGVVGGLLAAYAGPQMVAWDCFGLSVNLVVEYQTFRSHIINFRAGLGQLQQIVVLR